MSCAVQMARRTVSSASYIAARAVTAQAEAQDRENSTNMEEGHLHHQPAPSG